jgi:hypothetical protein
MNQVIDCKMLVREVSNSRCFYVDHGTYHEVLLDSLNISADREATEANIASITARLAAVEQENAKLREAVDSAKEAMKPFADAYQVGYDKSFSAQVCLSYMNPFISYGDYREITAALAELEQVTK